jgi:hypothetical protein
VADLAAQARADIDAALLAAYLANPASAPSGSDPALWAELKLMGRKLRAARKLVEGYTQRLFAPQKIAVTYELNEPYVLPDGATAIAVTGFFKTLADLQAFSLEEYRKGISINRELPWSAALAQTYTVEMDAVADAEWFDLACEAILELASEWYRHRETTIAGVAVITALPVSWQVKLAPARLIVLGE